MKKLMLFSLTFLFCLAFQTMNAQGRFDVNFGVGLLPTFAKDNGKTKLLPLTLNAHYKITPNFSLGAFAGHSVTETNREFIQDGELTQWKNRFTAVGIRAAAHTDKLYKWDIYGGMVLSYNYSNIEVIEGNMDILADHMGIKEKSGKFSASAFLGARYELTEHVGLFGELGFGISILTLGAGYQF